MRAAELIYFQQLLTWLLCSERLCHKPSYLPSRNGTKRCRRVPLRPPQPLRFNPSHAEKAAAGRTDPAQSIGPGVELGIARNFSAPSPLGGGRSASRTPSPRAPLPRPRRRPGERPAAGTGSSRVPEGQNFAPGIGPGPGRLSRRHPRSRPRASGRAAPPTHRAATAPWRVPGRRRRAVRRRDPGRPAPLLRRPEKVRRRRRRRRWRKAGAGAAYRRARGGAPAAQPQPEGRPHRGCGGDRARPGEGKGPGGSCPSPAPRRRPSLQGQSRARRTYTG